MAGIRFRIGDVFPHEDIVSQFLTGLCLAINDITMVMRNLSNTLEPSEDRYNENLYNLYLLCAYYREAAHFLAKGLNILEVSAFLDDLSQESREKLETIKDSFTPWEGSFVKDKLKPIRDVVFHYTPMSLDRIRPHLESASNESSDIEMGDGTYQETRYKFADAVFVKYVLDQWGHSASEIRDIMVRIKDLSIDLLSVAHEAVDAQLGRVDQQAFEVIE